jgi:uncharacterized membrane-anchored protein YitT (DUF2179 family)
MIRNVGQIILPGYACIYFVVSLFFDIPAVAQVLAALALLTLIVNALAEFYLKSDGQIVIRKDPDGRKTFLLEINKDPNELEVSDTVIFKVTKESSPGYNEP